MDRLRPLVVLLLVSAVSSDSANSSTIDKAALKQQAYEMFMHGYRSYMDYAWPADELMPLSCKGRVRGVTPCRGDVDDSLGNFSLTLIDTLDTLIVVGEYDEFERAVERIIETVRFDSDLVVSVFETNIRVLGGLISGHLMAELLREKQPERMQWYTNRQMIRMAVDLADRLLPAFNTTSGLPYSRINLRHGMQDYLKRQKDTCTACGGTMLLEMAALSRLTGNPVYEDKAKAAMDFLWRSRATHSDLMGTVLDVHNGAWIRRESGIGAGIDSYYEYCLKAYILLGDQSYLDRFNRHYDGIMRYLSKGPLFFDVQMHRPTIATRSFMDALLAFWPGLQVLKGDLSEAVKMHEMLFQVVQKHKFLPEAFTHDLQVHWAEHPLRPEFIESTYFLYRATKDPHYLEVAKTVMDSLNAHVRVRCGWTGIKDIRTMAHEDRMDSFVLSETFKYLYMIFAEKEELLFDPDSYVLTTEAHFLPLNLGDGAEAGLPRRLLLDPDERLSDAALWTFTPAIALPAAKTREDLGRDIADIRKQTATLLEELALLHRRSDRTTATATGMCLQMSERLRGSDFNPLSGDHQKMMDAMGISVTITDEKTFLVSQSGEAAASKECREWGEAFMLEINEIARLQIARRQQETRAPPPVPVYLHLVSPPFHGHPLLFATMATFGSRVEQKVTARAVMAMPSHACTPLINAAQVAGRMLVTERGGCPFVQKARLAQAAGAMGILVVDHMVGSSHGLTPAFTMSGDGEGKDDDIFIPSAFLYHAEGTRLLQEIIRDPHRPVVVSLHVKAVDRDQLFSEWLQQGAPSPSSFANAIETCAPEEGLVLRIDRGPRECDDEDDAMGSETVIHLAFRFGPVSQDSEGVEHQGIMERHVAHLMDITQFAGVDHQYAFMNLVRSAGYTALGLAVEVDKTTTLLRDAIRLMQIDEELPAPHLGLSGRITRVRCTVQDVYIPCVVVPGA